MEDVIEMIQKKVNFGRGNLVQIIIVSLYLLYGMCVFTINGVLMPQLINATVYPCLSFSQFTEILAIINALASLVYSFISLKIPRLQLLKICAFMLMILDLGTAFAPNIQMIMGMRILGGFFFQIILALSQTSVSELSIYENRAYFFQFLFFSYTLGQLMSVIISLIPLDTQILFVMPTIIFGLFLLVSFYFILDIPVFQVTINAQKALQTTNTLIQQNKQNPLTQLEREQILQYQPPVIQSKFPPIESYFKVMLILRLQIYFMQFIQQILLPNLLIQENMTQKQQVITLIGVQVSQCMSSLLPVLSLGRHNVVLALITIQMLLYIFLIFDPTNIALNCVAFAKQTIITQGYGILINETWKQRAQVFGIQGFICKIIAISLPYIIANMQQKNFVWAIMTGLNFVIILGMLKFKGFQNEETQNLIQKQQN